MASKQSSTQANKKQMKRRIEEGRKKRENLFENRFKSGGEENERRMVNNVMQGMRAYDRYLVCLDLA